MSIYRITFYEGHFGNGKDEDYRDGTHNGYVYVGSMADVRREIAKYAVAHEYSKKVIRERAYIQKLPVPKSKAALLDFLNQWGGHAEQ